MNGKFSDPQRDLYNAVLNVHRSCVSLCREDAGLSLDRLHSVAETGLRDQLIQLGFDVSGGVGFPVYHKVFSMLTKIRPWAFSSLTTWATILVWTCTTAPGIPGDIISRQANVSLWSRMYRRPSVRLSMLTIGAVASTFQMMSGGRHGSGALVSGLRTVFVLEMTVPLY